MPINNYKKTKLQEASTKYYVVNKGNSEVLSKGFTDKESAMEECAIILVEYREKYGDRYGLNSIVVAELTLAQSKRTTSRNFELQDYTLKYTDSFYNIWKDYYHEGNIPNKLKENTSMDTLEIIRGLLITEILPEYEDNNAFGIILDEDSVDESIYISEANTPHFTNVTIAAHLDLNHLSYPGFRPNNKKMAEAIEDELKEAEKNLSEDILFKYQEELGDEGIFEYEDFDKLHDLPDGILDHVKEEFYTMLLEELDSIRFVCGVDVMVDYEVNGYVSPTLEVHTWFNSSLLGTVTLTSDRFRVDLKRDSAKDIIEKLHEKLDKAFANF